jgi:hypothetical protein
MEDMLAHYFEHQLWQGSGHTINSLSLSLSRTTKLTILFSVPIERIYQERWELSSTFWYMQTLYEKIV